MNDEPPILRFHSRAHTYSRKSLSPAKDYAQAEERSRRSFYKFVCKEGLFGKLKRELRYGYEFYTRGPCPHYGTPFANGYPVWDAPRSYVRELWNAEFTKHLRPIREQHEVKQLAEYKARAKAWDRIYNLRQAKRSPLLQLNAAANALRNFSTESKRSR
jgi:hypothetical protein